VSVSTLPRSWFGAQLVDAAEAVDRLVVDPTAGELAATSPEEPHDDPAITLWTYVSLMDEGLGGAEFLDAAVGLPGLHRDAHGGDHSQARTSG
jgi:hypothetical protein